MSAPEQELPRKEAHSVPRFVLQPPKGWSSLGLGELWHSRDLLVFLAWRDVKVRYTQAALGAAWAVVQPLLMMAVFSLVLGRLADVPSNGIAYPVFVFSGLVPWTFFSNAVSSSTDSLVTNANLVSKVYFNRLVSPLAALLAWLPDFFIASVLLGFIMLLFGMVPAWTSVLLPVLALWAMLAAASVGVLLSALNVAYRDVRYAVPFLLQLGLFATPVVYPASLVPDRFEWLLGLNPMSGVVESFRWAVTGSTAPSWVLVATSVVVSAALLFAGMRYFRRVEHLFADVI